MEKSIRIRSLTVLAVALALLVMAESRAENKKTEVEMDKGRQLKTATFAGGCFWCIEAALEKIDGVVTAVSGYCGGDETDPTYEAVSAGKTGHFEAVQVRFDPVTTSYNALLSAFFRQIDPTDGSGSFVDRGDQYRSAVFYHNDQQKGLALAAIEEINRSGRFDRPVATKVLPLKQFYPAEAYHQDYYKKNAVRYTFYRLRSGRDQFIERMWGREDKAEEKGFEKPSRQELKSRLSSLAYHVTQEDGTERAFDNEYWDSKAAGIFVDIVSGEPLFSSTDKFDSGTGWPSFTRPIEPGAVVEKKENGFFTSRTEVRSKMADSHLGHVFDDGPGPTGLRYCINSAALAFVPAADLEREGLGKYQHLFDVK